MRAGKLDRIIQIQAYTQGEPDGYGNVSFTWADLVTLRAQIITATTEEFMRAYGEQQQTAIAFRTHFVEGITPGNRVAYDGRFFDIKETKEIGRRQGMELRCEELRA